MKNGKRKPVRFIKEGKNQYVNYARYSFKVNCGIMKVNINSQDEYPIRVRIEPRSGGCEALLEGISRLVTLLLECNIDIRFIIEQLKKVRCKSCMRKMGKASVEGGKEEVRKLTKSCPAGLGEVLERFMEEEEEAK